MKLKEPRYQKKRARIIGVSLIASASLLILLSFGIILLSQPSRTIFGGIGNARDATAAYANIELSAPYASMLIEGRTELQENIAHARELEAQKAAEAQRANASELLASLDIKEDYRTSFIHGEKPGQFQKYIVLHDTEGSSSAQSVINWWDSNGQGVAAHFIINKDGSIIQCVSLDKIAHHAGYGDTGHNALFGVEDESRDDKIGTTSIGSWAADYGMNSHSIGIELVHVGGEGDYPSAQLDALDSLIEYIDSYYGFESQIIDHKDWRSGNSDTSPEFYGYFQNYKTFRNHQGNTK